MPDDHDDLALRLREQFDISPCFAYGRTDPLHIVHALNKVYRCLADPNISDTRKRAQNAANAWMAADVSYDLMSTLPSGIAAPIQEALRTCQLMPPGDWNSEGYHLIGRKDLAANASNAPALPPLNKHAPVKEYHVSSCHPLSDR